MKLPLIAACAALMIATATAEAQRSLGYDRSVAEVFRANEFNFDAHASYSDPRRNVLRSRDGTWGGGVGLNYFFTKHVGLSAETYFQEGGMLFDHISSSFIARLPLDEMRLAPYGLAGVSRRWDPVSEWGAHLGAGLEFRFNPNMGVFADGRRVFPDKTSNHTLVRLGMRFVF